MPMIDDADVQRHLPVDKLKVEGIPDDRSDIYMDAERVVRGYLYGVVDSAVVALWITPAATPEIIRSIAGRLAAARIYRNRFGEQSMTDPGYAQTLYKEAMDMLNSIISGDVLIDGVAQIQFDNTYFQPNDASDPPKFTMADRY